MSITDQCICLVMLGWLLSWLHRCHASVQLYAKQACKKCFDNVQRSPAQTWVPQQCTVHSLVIGHSRNRGGFQASHSPASGPLGAYRKRWGPQDPHQPLLVQLHCPQGRMYTMHLVCEICAWPACIQHLDSYSPTHVYHHAEPVLHGQHTQFTIHLDATHTTTSHPCLAGKRKCAH